MSGETTADERRMTSRLYLQLLRDPRLVALTAASFLGKFGTELVAPVLPSIGTALGVSDGQVGLLMTLFTLPGIAMVPVLGMLADTYGRRVVLLPSLLVFGVAGAAIAFVDGFVAILALRFLQGMVAGAIIPLAITIIGDVYGGEVGSTAQGIRISANGIASVVVPAAAGFLAGIAWNVPFLLYALAVPVVVFGYWYVPELELEAPETGVIDQFREYGRRIAAEFTDVNQSVIIAGGFFRGFAVLAILTFVPLFAVRELGASLAVAGLLLSVRGVARIAVSSFSGFVLGVVSRKQALFGTLVISGGATVLLPSAPNVLWLGALMGVYGVGDALFTPVHRDTLTALASDDSRASAVSAMVILRRVGSTLSPAVFGLLLAVIGFQVVFVVSGAVLLLYGGLLFVFLSGDT